VLLLPKLLATLVVVVVVLVEAGATIVAAIVTIFQSNCKIPKNPKTHTQTLKILSLQHQRNPSLLHHTQKKTYPTYLLLLFTSITITTTSSSCSSSWSSSSSHCRFTQTQDLILNPFFHKSPTSGKQMPKKICLKFSQILDLILNPQHPLQLQQSLPHIMSAKPKT
jgi:hypothetical protein